MRGAPTNGGNPTSRAFYYWPPLAGALAVPSAPAVLAGPPGAVPLVFFPVFAPVPESLVVTTVPAPGPGPCFPGAEPGFTFTCADAPTAKPAISATINTIVRF